MSRQWTITLLLWGMTLVNTVAQPVTDSLRVVCWNVENFFDHKDDTLTLDDEFTPEGERHWTLSRYLTKRNNIYKTLVACGGFTPPEIIGLCEVENFDVLNDLLNGTPLKKFRLGLIHRESPDRRGIDVALLYNPKKFAPFAYKFLPLVLDGDTLNSRYILQASGTVFGGDTLHLFVNHWPSRYGGVLETVPYRKAVARLLRAHCDSLLNNSKAARIVIMGDFNDTPSDESMEQVLKAKPVTGIPLAGELYNLSYNWQQGTLKYQGRWEVFDQLVVSGSVLADSRWQVDEHSASIVKLPFLLIDDERYLGVKPFRTYTGYRYQGGFSDHLPVKLVIRKR